MSLQIGPLLPSPFFVPPQGFTHPAELIPTDRPLPSPASTCHKDFILNGLRKDLVLDEEYAYSTAAAQETTSCPIPPPIVEPYKKLLSAPLVIRHIYMGTAYELRKSCAEQMAFVRRYATELNIPIRWVMRGSQLLAFLKGVYIKDKLSEKHPAYKEKIQQLDCSDLEINPLDVDFHAQCLTQQGAFDIANAHMLCNVFEHFQQLEFELRFSKEKIMGFEAFCQRTCTLTEAERNKFHFLEISNKNIPWMHRKNWSNERLRDFLDAVIAKKKEIEDLRDKPTLLKQQALYNYFSLHLFERSFIDLKSEIEKSIQFQIPPHSVERQIGDKRVPLYRRVVFEGETKKQMDFTHFNADNREDQAIVSTDQNIYLEIPECPLQTDQVRLFYSEQALLDVGLGLFRLFNFERLESKWPFYCYALTKGKLCPQRNVREKMQGAFIAQKSSPVDTLDSMVKKIKSHYPQKGNAALFSFLFHATDLSPATWSAFLENFSPLDPRNFSSPVYLKAVLQLYAWCQLQSSSKAPFTVGLCKQHGEDYFEVQLDGFYLYIPFDPVSALNTFNAESTKDPNLLPPAYGRPYLNGSEKNLPPLPAVDAKRWLELLNTLFERPQHAQIGFALLRYSTAVVASQTLFVEGLRRCSVLRPEDQAITDWLISIIPPNELLTNDQEALKAALQNHTVPSPFTSLYNYYLDSKRRATVAATAPNFRKALLSAAPPITPEPRPETRKAIEPPPVKPVRETTGSRFGRRPPKIPPSKPIPKVTEILPPAPIKAAPQKIAAALPPPPKVEEKKEVAHEPPRITPDEHLKQLFEEFSKEKPKPDYLSILEISSKTSIIPRLDGLKSYFRKSVAKATEVDFLCQFYEILISRGDFKKGQDLYKSVLSNHLQRTLTLEEQSAWLSAIMKHIVDPEAGDAVLVALSNLENHCTVERSCLLDLFDQIPFPLSESRLQVYVELMGRLNLKRTCVTDLFIEQSLKSGSPEHLRLLLLYLTATEASNPHDWIILFKKIAKSNNIPLIRKAYEIGQKVLQRIPAEQDPREWTDLQAIHFRLFFLLCRPDPSEKTHTAILALWNALSGPPELGRERRYAFVLNFLKVFHTTITKEPYWGLVRKWHDHISRDTQQLKEKHSAYCHRLQIRLNLYYTSFMTRQSIKVTFNEELALFILLQDAIIATPKAPWEIVKQGWGMMAHMFTQKQQMFAPPILEHFLEYTCLRLNELTSPEILSIPQCIGLALEIQNKTTDYHQELSLKLFAHSTTLARLALKRKLMQISQVPERLMSSIVRQEFLETLRLKKLPEAVKGVSKSFAKLEEKFAPTNEIQNVGKVTNLEKLAKKYSKIKNPHMPIQALTQRVICSYLQMIAEDKLDYPERIIDSLEKDLDGILRSIEEDELPFKMDGVVPSLSFLEDLLNLQPESQDVAFLILILYGYNFRFVFATQPTQRQALCQLLPRLSLHPAFQNVELEKTMGFQGAVINHLIQQEKFPPTTSAKAWNFFHLNLYAEWDTHHPLKAEESLTVYKELLQGLFAVGNAYALRRILRMLEACPETIRLAECTVALTMILDRLKASSWSKPIIIDILCEIQNVFRIEKEVLKSTVFYNNYFSFALEVLDLNYINGKTLYEDLVFMQLKEEGFGLEALDARRMRQQIIHREQVARLRTLISPYTNAKLNSLPANSYCLDTFRSRGLILEILNLFKKDFHGNDVEDLIALVEKLPAPDSSSALPFHPDFLKTAVILVHHNSNTPSTGLVDLID